MVRLLKILHRKIRIQFHANFKSTVYAKIHIHDTVLTLSGAFKLTKQLRQKLLYLQIHI